VGVPGVLWQMRAAIKAARASFPCLLHHHYLLHPQGMVENRRCRDVLFLLLFIAYWAGMFVVCGIAFQEGEG
jgi:hypothetical protein